MIAFAEKMLAQIRAILARDPGDQGDFPGQLSHPTLSLLKCRRPLAINPKTKQRETKLSTIGSYVGERERDADRNRMLQPASLMQW
jgi:hypothetical protein